MKPTAGITWLIASSTAITAVCVLSGIRSWTAVTAAIQAAPLPAPPTAEKAQATASVGDSGEADVADSDQRGADRRAASSAAARCARAKAKPPRTMATPHERQQQAVSRVTAWSVCFANTTSIGTRYRTDKHHDRDREQQPPHRVCLRRTVKPCAQAARKPPSWSLAMRSPDAVTMISAVTRKCGVDRERGAGALPGDHHAGEDRRAGRRDHRAEVQDPVALAQHAATRQFARATLRVRAFAVIASDAVKAHEGQHQGEREVARHQRHAAKEQRPPRSRWMPSTSAVQGLDPRGQERREQGRREAHRQEQAGGPSGLRCGRRRGSRARSRRSSCRTR